MSQEIIIGTQETLALLGLHNEAELFHLFFAKGLLRPLQPREPNRRMQYQFSKAEVIQALAKQQQQQGEKP